jgi:hypothetical protein
MAVFDQPGCPTSTGALNHQGERFDDGHTTITPL